MFSGPFDYCCVPWLLIYLPYFYWQVQPEVTAAAPVVTKTTETVRALRAGSPMRYSLTHQAKQGKPLNLRPNSLCFISKDPKGPSESEVYRRMLITHRQKLRHVDRF